jgi:hypothetical protein
MPGAVPRAGPGQAPDQEDDRPYTNEELVGKALAGGRRAPGTEPPRPQGARY